MVWTDQQILKYDLYCIVEHITGKYNQLADFLNSNFLPDRWNTKLEEVEAITLQIFIQSLKYKARGKVNR